MESAETCLASLRGCAARRSKWRRAAPTPPACDSHVHGGQFRQERFAGAQSRFRRPIQEPLGDGRVAIDAAVTQKWPVTPNLFQLAQIYLAYQNLFFLGRSFGDHRAERITQERSSPELQARPRRLLAADVARLETHAVDRRHVHAIRDSMCSLDGAPGVVLGRAVLFLFCRMPPDRGGIKE